MAASTKSKSKGTSSDGRLAGKICLVTGGAGNIGTEITKRFLAEGAEVIVTGRNADKLNRLVKDVSAAATNGEASHLYPLVMDGGNPESVQQGLAELIKLFEGKRHPDSFIDVLVNNAGSAGPKQPIEAIPFTPEDLALLKSQGFADTETMSDAVQNILGITWTLIRHAFPLMAEGGSIINVSTIFSRTAYYGRIPYSVPKSALNALSRRLAEELGTSKKAIRLNTVYPGPIDSDRIRTVFAAMDKLQSKPNGSTAEHFFDTMLLNRDADGKAKGDGEFKKRFPKIEDVVGTMVFLASDESKAFTSHRFEVTNGMTIPMESRTTLTSRPRLRISDGTNQTTLIIAGDQIGEAFEYARVLREANASVHLVFQNPVFYEKALLEKSGFPIYHFSALDKTSMEKFFTDFKTTVGGVNSVLVLPRCEKNFQNAYLLDDSDEIAAKFLNQEIVGVTAIASALTRFFKATEHLLSETPKVMFVSSPAYGTNAFHDVLRGAIEELIRIWRDEEAVKVQAGRKTFGVIANQLIRFTNKAENNLQLTAGFVSEFFNTAKTISEISLYLPEYLEQPSRTSLIDSLYGLHLGKVAVITGGSAGIGGQIGRFLAIAGARVVLSARKLSELDEARKSILVELKRIGYSNAAERVMILPDIDVANETGLGKLIEFSLKQFGRIDYLINNAGIAGAEQMVVDMTLADWRHTLQSNMVSNFSLMRKVLPLMKRQGFGHILNVSSYFGGEKYVAVPYPNRADYAVSKAGQRAIAESFAKFLGPEIMINAIAPGPVDGVRLRGSEEKAGLFLRRGKMILTTKRLNDVYASVIKALNEGAKIADIMESLALNSVTQLIEASTVHQRITNLCYHVQKHADPDSGSYTHLMDKTIAAKLVERLKLGNYIVEDFIAEKFLSTIAFSPLEFFAKDSLVREAKKINDGIISMLYLKRMPTEDDVALATVHYLATDNISGETFHPSGGLRFDRTVTEGELFGKPKPERLAQFEGQTIYIFGDYLYEELTQLIQAYLNEYKVARVVLFTKNTYTADRFRNRTRFTEALKAGRFKVQAIGMQLEGAIDKAVTEYGRPAAVISTPFDPLPVKPLVADKHGNWDAVFNEKDFEEVVENHLTYHFRIARKVSLLGELQIVLVTPKTSQQSTAEEFALANFIKTSLHSLTVTLGVENERCIHHSAVNQVDLTRRARTEKPQTPDEITEELERFVTAVLLTSAPLPNPDDSRYRSRIYRGNAITV
jgi:malonyl-CoA reductase/3-hydroxypropionate dehydrogenase (NADP+)